MVEVYSLGQMEEPTKVTILTIKSKGTALSPGLMGACTKATGTMASNTARVCIATKRARHAKASGAKARELSGSRVGRNEKTHK